MHTITIVGNKGGIGKTTITMNLAGCLSEQGRRVLVVDFNHQANLTTVFTDHPQITIMDLLLRGAPIQEAIHKTSWANIDLIPADPSLADLDANLAGNDDAQYLLLEQLQSIDSNYDFALIDCPNSLAKATRMALVASRYFLVPIECQEWAVKASGQMLAYADKVRKRANPDLKLLGFVINKFDARRNVEKEYKALLNRTYGVEVFQSEFRNSVAYIEAATSRTPINFYLPKSEHAISYHALLKEIEDRIAKESKADPLRKMMKFAKE